MERYRGEHFPSWMEEHLSSSKAMEVPRRKKKSLWNWAPIRAIAKIRQQQFQCVFSIFVQTIDGLPSSLDGLRLIVQLERKHKLWQTMPSRVFHSIAEFDETLHIETTIYGRKVSIQDQAMKFMPKDYILSVVAIDAGEHFLFNHHCIDLSGLLPTSMEGFWEPDKPMSSTASFKLGGKAEGAVLVATFDFEVLNEELRLPRLPVDGNASTRFGGSPLQCACRAFKSLPNSPNASPFVRRSNYHFTSPCTSDLDSNDSIYIEKLDLDSSVKETEERSLQDYCSSDEERYQALRNDPLCLDASAETEPVAPSTPTRSREELGPLDDFSTQLHLAFVDNTNCVEKVEVSPLILRTKTGSESHQIDDGRLLGGREPENEGTITIHKPQGNHKFFSQNEEGDFSLAELASDKFCIDVEIVESSSIANDFSTMPMFSPSAMQSKSPDDSGQVLIVQEAKLCLEVNEKHMVAEGGQTFTDETSCCPSRVFSKDRSVACLAALPDSSIGALGQHSCKLSGYGGDLVEGSKFLIDCADGIVLKPLESVDAELDILPICVEDDVLALEADVVAEDFFNLLEREGEITSTRPNSPRSFSHVEPRQEFFLQECLRLGAAELNATNYPLQDRQEMNEIMSFVKSVGSGPSTHLEDDFLQTNSEGDLGLLSIIEAAESEIKKAAQTLRSKERAKMLENAEIEALIKQWGLSDRIFESSPPNPTSLRFQCLPSQMPHTSGMASVIKLKDGGSLRVMSLDCFQSCSSLVMQVSRPVVVPAKTGSCAVDIFRCMASKGLENMMVQAFLKMPLEDLAGLTMEQFTIRESAAGLNSGSSKLTPRQGSFARNTLRESGELVEGTRAGSAAYKPHGAAYKPHGFVTEELVSLGDLIHAALKKIEALAMEGLKVQCDLSKEAPYSVTIKDTTLEKNRSNQVMIGLGESSYISSDQRIGAEEHHPDVDSLLDMTVPLDEWLQLSEGVIEGEHGRDLPGIMAGNAVSQLYLETSAIERRECTKTNDTSEHLTWASSNGNLTVAMLLQLRDPQCYYEPVGALMMALVQAERVMQPCQRLNLMKDERDSINVADSNQHKLHGRKTEVQLKITGVHVSGLKLLDENKFKCWGSKKQLQSGSRWLLANFKANNSRHMVSESSHLEAKAKASKGEILWSISACVCTTGTTWKDTADFCAHIRNPDLMFATNYAVEVGKSHTDG